MNSKIALILIVLVASAACVPSEFARLKRGLLTSTAVGAGAGGLIGAAAPSVSAKEGAIAGGLTGLAVGAVKKHNKDKDSSTSGSG